MLQQEGSAVGKSIGRRSVSFLRSLAKRRTFAGSLGERGTRSVAQLCLCLFQSAKTVCLFALRRQTAFPSPPPARAAPRAGLGPRSPSFSTSFFWKGQRSKSGNKRNLRSSNYTALSPSALSVCPAATRYSATPDGRKEERRLPASLSAPVIRRGVTEACYIIALTERATDLTERVSAVSK